MGNNGLQSIRYNKQLRGKQLFGKGYFESPPSYSQEKHHQTNTQGFVDSCVERLDIENRQLVIWLMILLVFVLCITYYF